MSGSSCRGHQQYDGNHLQGPEKSSAHHAHQDRVGKDLRLRVRTRAWKVELILIIRDLFFHSVANSLLLIIGLSDYTLNGAIVISISRSKIF